jgi:hypothetical protein
VASRDDTAYRLVAGFADPALAREAAAALIEGGVSPARISLEVPDIVSQDVSTAAGRRESLFFRRFVVTVTLWSVAGAALGVPVAAILTAVGIGPGGSEGFVLQLVAWIIFWHLMIGLWAGYALLMDRTQFTPGRLGGNSARVEVACRDGDEAARLTELLRQRGATSVQPAAPAMGDR